jgi:hypothetical protein
MLRRNSAHTVSWILLLYFAFFIVPPLSSFASAGSQPAFAGGTEYRLQQGQGNGPLLLFDIILWQKLKKARHSAFLKSIQSCTAFGKEAHNFPDVHEAATVPPGECACFLSDNNHSPLSRHSRCSDIRFTRSGISPPTVRA